jgi:hypothetical protein
VIMFKFLERTTYDKVESAVLSVYRKAITERNVTFLQRGLPIITIAEDLQPITDEEGKTITEQLVIAAYDNADENMFIPKIVQLNKEAVKKLTDGDLVTAIEKALKYDTEYVTEKDMEDTELTFIGKEGDVLDPVCISTIARNFAEESKGTPTGPASDVVDLDTFKAALKTATAETVEEGTKEAKGTAAHIDEYTVSLEKSETSTILTEANKRYKGAPLSDSAYEDMLEEVETIQDILDSGIESSGMSKMPSESPDKRLAIRNAVIGHHKEYLSHKMMQGKKLDMVVVLDRSGSMGGAPSRDSAILIAALNNLAHLYPELSCSVLFSDSRNYTLMDFPVGTINDRELLTFTKTHGDEGIAENMDKEMERLEKADCVFVYTDGDIISKPVDKPLFTAKGIELVGLYTAKGKAGESLSVEDYHRHYDKNSAWFHNVIVSSTPTDLAENMVDYMTR